MMFTRFLTLPRLRLHFSKAQGRKDFACNVGVHWIALEEYSQRSTHMSGFQYLF